MLILNYTSSNTAHLADSTVISATCGLYNFYSYAYTQSHFIYIDLTYVQHSLNLHH